ncbi:MAG: hypothetical protein JKY48_17110 [Flavobacteriales bacterium]|nr:hypothetical protein [Flavobacteriales bacterium]
MLIFGPDLKKLYSIIDIEATGGNAKIGRITEVAILVFDGEKIIQEYSTLVNPERKIPHYVQRLTGISDKMVSVAPLFKEVAQDIFDILNSTCFVAHNVKADYSFIKTELENAGISYTSERLCTLELSKELIPDSESHGLGKICKHLSIEVEGRHRAKGDALATVELFKHLQILDSTNQIDKFKRKA